MNKLQEAIARMIFAQGAIKFGEFKFKHHEKEPWRPLSPNYISLRSPENPSKPGTLMPADFNLIALWFLETLREKITSFHAVAGIPHAGDPIVEALERITPAPRGFRIVKLGKKEEDGKRCIVPLQGFEYKKGEIIVLVDDLVTEANTKVEAINAIREQGGIVYDLVILVDRQQGGREGLEKAGIKVHSCFLLIQLFDFYLREGMIDKKKYDECLDYMISN